MKKVAKALHGEKGFTLVELLIVGAILGVLAAVIIPSLANMLGVADVSAANTEADIVRTAVLAYRVDHTNAWPDGTFTGAGGVLDPYFDKDIIGGACFLHKRGTCDLL